MIRTKSVHTPIDPEEDGVRILVARLRGRGLPTNRYDVWMANLGPSERLLRGFQSGKTSWGAFSRAYRQEIAGSTAEFDRRNATIKNHGQKWTLRLLQELGRKGNVTLLCHCAEDQPHCHRHVLEKLLKAKV